MGKPKKQMKGAEFKKMRRHKRLAALGRSTCPQCNDGTTLIPLPQGIKIPVSMGAGDKAKTVWVTTAEVGTKISCCTKCQWHTGAPAGNVEWTKFTSRERGKEHSYEKALSVLKQAAWRTSGEPRLESAYKVWVQLGLQIDEDLLELRHAVTGQLVRRLCREFYLSKGCQIFVDGKYSGKAVDKVIRALIYLDHGNEAWRDQWAEALTIDNRLAAVPGYAEPDVLEVEKLQAIADGTTAYRREARSVANAWVQDLLDNPSVVRAALASEQPVMMKDAFGEGHTSFTGDDRITVRFIVRLMTKFQGQPKVRARKELAAPAVSGFPPCYILESKAAVDSCSTALKVWDAATASLAERYWAGSKIVLAALPRAMQRFFCVETIGWSEPTFQAYTDTSWVYDKEPEIRGPLKDAAALASLVERYTNSGLLWIMDKVRHKHDLAYGYNSEEILHEDY